PLLRSRPFSGLGIGGGLPWRWVAGAAAATPFPERHRGPRTDPLLELKDIPGCSRFIRPPESPEEMVPFGRRRPSDLFPTSERTALSQGDAFLDKPDTETDVLFKMGCKGQRQTEHFLFLVSGLLEQELGTEHCSRSTYPDPEIIFGPSPKEKLDETDYLDPFKSGFRPGYGTEFALVTLYDDLCRERHRGSASLLVLLDLSTAFDTINCGILLDRLVGLEVGGTARQWFRSYLDGQFQKVVLGDFGSAPWQLCRGVPQGSFLSPLLFNIYMKPLGEVIRRFGLQNHQYTDDTQLYLSFSTDPGEAVAVLNQCLAEVVG
ncbi:Retrovirus-related Pol polyprotein from type-1 retrotransposable element R2, partial [Varanus komodoensis]